MTIILVGGFLLNSTRARVHTVCARYPAADATSALFPTYPLSMSCVFMSAVVCDSGPFLCPTEWYLARTSPRQGVTLRDESANFGPFVLAGNEAHTEEVIFFRAKNNREPPFQFRFFS